MKVMSEVYNSKFMENGVLTFSKNLHILWIESQNTYVFL